LGGRIGGAAGFTVVAVLVGCRAVRADALDVPVRQEHRLDRIVELLDRAPLDVPVGFQGSVEALRQLAVLGRMGGVVPVEVHPEIGKIPLLAGLGGLDELLGRDPGLFRGQHDRRAVGIVGADEVHLASGHAPRPDPDVGLDVADQMADVEVAVAVGQGAGDDRGAGHVDWRCGEGGLSHAAPAPAGARRLPSRRTVNRRGGTAVAGYGRIQTCDLQMKATQPDTLSLLPPSISSIFDLYTLPSSGLRMVPPAYASPLGFIPRMISMPVIGLPLRSSLHSSQVGFGLLG